MNCKQCGALLHEFSRFCPECGSPVSGDAVASQENYVQENVNKPEIENVNQPEMPDQNNTVQPEIPEPEQVDQPETFMDNQGYGGDYSQQYAPQPFDGTYYNNTESPKKNLKPLLILLIPLLVIIIVISVVLYVIFGGGNGFDTPEEAVERYIYSYYNNDAEEFLEMVPEDYLEDVMDEYRMDEDEILDCVEEYLEDIYMYDRNDDRFYLSDIGNVDVKIKKVKKLSKSGIKELKQSLRFKTALFKMAKISGCVHVSAVNKLYDKDEDLLLKEEEIYTAFEYEDEWYSWHACIIIYFAVENY